MTLDHDPATALFCSGDECLAQWPEGPLPPGWTVENVEGRIEPCCPDCTEFYAAQAVAHVPT